MDIYVYYASEEDLEVSSGISVDIPLKRDVYEKFITPTQISPEDFKSLKQGDLISRIELVFHDVHGNEYSGFLAVKVGHKIHEGFFSRWFYASFVRSDGKIFENIDDDGNIDLIPLVAADGSNEYIDLSITVDDF